MRLQNFKRLIKTDFDQEQQSLVEQLGESLNPGIEIVYQALNKRLTIGDNLQASERDVDIRVGANGVPTSSTFTTVDFTPAQVRTVWVGRAENLTNSAIYPTSAPFISFNNTPTGIQITNVTGLAAGYTWRLRILLFG